MPPTAERRPRGRFAGSSRGPRDGRDSRAPVPPQRPWRRPRAPPATPAPAQSSLRIRSGDTMPDPQMRGLGSGYDRIAAEAGRRHRVRPGEASRLDGEQTVEHAAARPGVPEGAGVPGFRLVIGVDGDPRAWGRVGDAPLDRSAAGAVRGASQVPPVTSLGLEHPAASGTAARAFRALASEGVLHWVPGLGYYVRTSITVAVSGPARQDGRLRAVLPDGGERQQAEPGMPASSGTEGR